MLRVFWSCVNAQEGELKDVLSACLAGEGVHVIELPIDYAASAELQVCSHSPTIGITNSTSAQHGLASLAWHPLRHAQETHLTCTSIIGHPCECIVRCD